MSVLASACIRRRVVVNEPHIAVRLRPGPRGFQVSQERLAFITIIGFAAVLRLIGLSAGLRIDERLTYQLFVSKSWATAVSDYTLVNNHVFHTILAKSAVAVFGPWLWALRLPAFIAGVLVVPASFFAIRPLYGARAALIAASLVATCSELVVYSANARGYSLVTLAFLLLLILAERLRGRSSPLDWTLYASVAALALWTIPAALYPVGGVSIWLGLSLVRRRSLAEMRPFALSMTCAGILTLAFYVPVLEHSGAAALVRNEYVVPSTWPVFLSEVGQSAGPTLFAWYRGLPFWVAVVFAACGAIALIRHDRVSQGFHADARVALPYVIGLWCVVLLMVDRRAPQVRMWQWFVPLGAGLIGAGVVHLIEQSGRASAFVARRFPVLVAAFTAIAAVSLLGAGFI